MTSYCKDCKYSFKISWAKDIDGFMRFNPHQCRRFPPQISQFGEFWGEYPAVEGEQTACGEFKPKGVPDDRDSKAHSGSDSYFSPGNCGH